jgi:hypothetical protein
MNYLAPNLSTAPWTLADDMLLIAKYRELGSRWVQLASFFPHRTDSMVKNRFNMLRRRGRFAGISKAGIARLAVGEKKKPRLTKTDRPEQPPQPVWNEEDFGGLFWADQEFGDGFDFWSRD